MSEFNAAFEPLCNRVDVACGCCAEIRSARPDRPAGQEAMAAFIENGKFANCIPQKEYILVRWDWKSNKIPNL